MNEQIEKYLAGAGEATAKTIANAIGLPQLEVSKALHRMHSTGTVERGKRPGGGNEYVYWLARGAPAELRAPAAASPSHAPEVANAGEPSRDVSGGVMESASPMECAGAVVAAPSLGVQSLALGSAASVDQAPSRSRPHPTDHAAATASTPIATEPASADARIAHLAADVARLITERDDALAVAQRLRANCAALEARIDELTLGPPGAAAPLFVTLGRKAPPRRHSSIENAQRRGAALVRSERESEVLVLEPVGRIVRGTEWRPR